MDDKIKKTTEIYKALSNPIRLKILVLCLNKELSSKELRKILGISKPLLISHLKKLVNAGLLEYEVEFDEKRMIIKKYYKTKNVNLCLMDVLNEINQKIK